MKRILTSPLFAFCGLGIALVVFYTKEEVEGVNISTAYAAPLEAIQCNTKGSAKLIQSLYDNYPFGGKGVDSEPETVLRQHFDETLTRLVLKNQQCEIREKGVCNIEANILYHSQDAIISDLRVCVAEGKSDTVEVSFKNFGAVEHIKYKLRKEESGWRISNIFYQDRTSLTRILNHTGL